MVCWAPGLINSTGSAENGKGSIDEHRHQKEGKDADESRDIRVKDYQTQTRLLGLPEDCRSIWVVPGGSMGRHIWQSH